MSVFAPMASDIMSLQPRGAKRQSPAKSMQAAASRCPMLSKEHRHQFFKLMFTTGYCATSAPRLRGCFFMLYLNSQKALIDVLYEDWCEDISKEVFTAFIYRISNNRQNFYRQKRIYQKNGKTRNVDVPSKGLKIIQRIILKRILENIPVHNSARAYIKGCSLRDNASVHCGRKCIVKLDIKKFFEHIDEKSVYLIFRRLSYPPDVCRMLAKLCCFKGRLPTGAPTSPYLSNLFMKKFDREMSLFCENKNISYTRYSDDITFSFDSFDKTRLIRVTRNFLGLYANGLPLNQEKIFVVTNNKKQKVTGLVVNKKPSVDKEVRRNIRQAVYYIDKFGVANHIRHLQSSDYGDWVMNKENDWMYDENNWHFRMVKLRYLRTLQGRISFCLCAVPDNSEMKQYAEFIKEIIKKEKEEICLLKMSFQNAKK